MKNIDFSQGQRSKDSYTPSWLGIVDQGLVSPVETSAPPESFILAQKVIETGESFSELKERDTYETNGVIAREILPISPTFEPARQFWVLQKWEGTITEIMNGECRAVVRNLSNFEAPKEEVVFSIQEISPLDHPLVAKGAVFYWAIGYEDPQGQRRRQSVIRFQRLPTWTQEELKMAEAEARNLKELFDGQKL